MNSIFLTINVHGRSLFYPLRLINHYITPTSVSFVANASYVNHRYPSDALKIRDLKRLIDSDLPRGTAGVYLRFWINFICVVSSVFLPLPLFIYFNNNQLFNFFPVKSTFHFRISL